MKKALKPLKILFAAVIFAAAMLFSASFLLQEKIAGIVIGIINSNVATRLEPASARLSFISSFPRGSLELRDVLVRSSTGFNRSVFGGISTDTLLSAKSVSVEFSLAGLFTGQYRIKRLLIRDGSINLLADASGGINYDLSRADGASSGSRLNMDLQGIILTGMKAVYNDLASGILLKGTIEKSRLKTSFRGRIIDFTASSTMQMEKTRLWGVSLPENLIAGLDINVRRSGDTTYFRKGTLTLDDQEFSLKGALYPGKIPSLHIAGDKVDVERSLTILPETIRKKLSNYNASGKMKMVADITGPLSKNRNPHIELTGILENGRIRKINSGVMAENISFSGSFTNGKQNNPASSSLSLHDIKMKFGSYRVSGTLNLSRFDDMQASATLKGPLRTEEIVDFFSLSQISDAAGTAQADLSLSARVPSVFSYSFTDLLSILKGEINFTDFGLAVRENGFAVSSATGGLYLAEDITTTNLSFRYRDHSVILNGVFSNFPDWLAAKKPVILTGKGDVEFKRLVPSRLFGWDDNKSGSTGGQVILPAVYNLDLQFKADTFIYRTFLAENVAGKMLYVKSEMNFSALSFRMLGGSVKGNGMFFQNSDRSFIMKGIFDINNIDINQSFVSFRNFGQEFIKAENLAGRLSGSISLLLPMNSSLDPQIKFLTADGKYVIANGSLINFEPVKKLSSYIELSELQNITFDKLENDFYIRSNFFYVPRMNINSSAVTLTVNGRHSFDNDYTYHVKMLLSEVLSRKYRRNRTKNSEDFGPVQDDGLGRTSLLLKVEGNGDVIKTGYDIKAAGEEIKSSMKKEKNNLKTILKEEYGWYKKDSTVKAPEPSKEQKQPRFRVVWDEDSK